MIGKTVFVFDLNRRVYQKGGVGGGPIWREHYRPEVVESETSRSWVTSNGTKVPKKGRDPRSVAISKEEIDRLEWVHEHRYKIVRLLERCDDADKVEKIASILGFQPPPQSGEPK